MRRPLFRSAVVIALRVVIACIMAGAAGRGYAADAPVADATPAAEAEATPAAAAPAVTCDDYIAALMNKTSPVAASDPVLQPIADKVPNLVICGAVLSDSDAVCKQLHPAPADCSTLWADFHALRNNAAARGYLLPDSEYEQCRQEKLMQPYCDGLRAATKAHDPSLCTAGGLNTFCRALVSLDPATCDRLTLDDVKAFPQVDNPREGLKTLKEQCRAQVARYTRFAAGLPAMAASAQSPERELAKAAQGDAAACKPFAESALRVCRTLPTPAAAAPAGGALKRPTKPAAHE
jgi:hypothetical protein